MQNHGVIEFTIAPVVRGELGMDDFLEPRSGSTTAVVVRHVRWIFVPGRPGLW